MGCLSKIKSSQRYSSANQKNLSLCVTILNEYFTNTSPFVADDGGREGEFMQKTNPAKKNFQIKQIALP